MDVQGTKRMRHGNYVLTGGVNVVLYERERYIKLFYLGQMSCINGHGVGLYWTSGQPRSATEWYWHEHDR